MECISDGSGMQCCFVLMIVELIINSWVTDDIQKHYAWKWTEKSKAEKGRAGRQDMEEQDRTGQRKAGYGEAKRDTSVQCI